MDYQVPQANSDSVVAAARALCHAAANADPYNDCQGLWDAVTVHAGGLDRDELLRLVRMLTARIAAESKVIGLLSRVAGESSVARIVASLARAVPSDG